MPKQNSAELEELVQRIQNIKAAILVKIQEMAEEEVKLKVESDLLAASQSLNTAQKLIKFAVDALNQTK